jgi:pyrimidine operon attenuation protein/uracil phosphoribosyltransferase
MDKMLEQHKLNGMTYARLAQRLRAKGHDVTNLQLFGIASRIREADKQLQNDIASILGCTRRDIF